MSAPVWTLSTVALSGLFGVLGVLLGSWLTHKFENKRWHQDVDLKRQAAWAELQQGAARDAHDAARQYWQAVNAIYQNQQRGENVYAEWSRSSDAGSQVTAFASLLENEALRNDLTEWARDVQRKADATLQDEAEPITYEWMKGHVATLRQLHERLSAEIRKIHHEYNTGEAPQVH